MSKKLSKLTMTIALLDKLSGPMRGVLGTIDNLERRAMNSFRSIGKGMAMLGATAAITIGALLPAGNVYAALGEVKSLGMAQSGLAALRQESFLFAAQWGDDSSAFIRSAYDIKSAISSLSDDQMPRATRAAGVLAKATKANVADMTSYFGTMYGIFQKQADKMGASSWLEQLAGKTASAVQMFKTTGPAMQQAFEALGAEGQTFGIDLNEQMAILGRMQSTMSGGGAGTKYLSFLQGIGKAEGKLGLKFTTDDGRMLGALDILSKIEGKFGDINKVADSDLLKEAFGRKEAVAFIKLLVKQRDLLKSDIGILGEQSGMDKAIEMAEAIANPWERIIQGSKALTASLGFDNLLSLIPIMNGIADAIERVIVMSVQEDFKYIIGFFAQAIGYVLAFVAALGGLWVAIGFFKLLLLAVSPLMPLIVALAGAFTALRIGWVMFIAAKAAGLGVLAAAQIGMMGFLGALHMNLMGLKLYRAAVWLVMAPFKLLRLAFMSAIPAVWGFTVALLANPITWIVLGIAALIAGLYMLVTHWDTVTAFVSDAWNGLVSLFRDNAWMQTIFFPLYLGIEVVDSILKSFDKIPQWWASLKGWLKTLDPFAWLYSQINGLIDKVNLIPGVDIDHVGTDASEQVAQTNAQLSHVLPNLTSQLAAPGPQPQGGLMQQYINSSNKSSGNRIDKIEVNNYGQGTNAQDLMHELEMEAG